MIKSCRFETLFSESQPIFVFVFYSPLPLRHPLALNLGDLPIFPPRNCHQKKSPHQLSWKIQDQLRNSSKTLMGSKGVEWCMPQRSDNAGPIDSGINVYYIQVGCGWPLMYSVMLCKQIGAFVSISTCGRVDLWISDLICLRIHFFVYSQGRSSSFFITCVASLVEKKEKMSQEEFRSLWPVRRTKVAFCVDRWGGGDK